jgi:hypothetical protein
MVGGKLVLEGTAEGLADREALVASYLGGEPVATSKTTALRRDEKDLKVTGGDRLGRRHGKNLNAGRGLGPATTKRGESP